jgi:hypothetical protein
LRFPNAEVQTLKTGIGDVRSQVLTAVSMKMAVFWVIAPRSLVELYDVSEVLAASIISLVMKAASISETSVNVYNTTRRNNPEDTHLQALEIFASRNFYIEVVIKKTRAQPDTMTKHE